MNGITLKAVIASVFVFAGASACGTEDPTLTSTGATTLTAQVADARAAVSSGDFVRAAELLNQLDATVAELRAADDISDARAEDVIGGVGDVRDALTQYAATTTTSTSTTTTTTEPERDDDNGRGRDKKQDDGESD